ncbi:MAG: heavy-metal-associated domain-containing protein [Bacillota bacterium]|jgi:copper chaperone|uniref:heavy-metal-associated domain-containing protein n=1 Tax=Fictibacillus TaxID=1329200 RepID=UPI0018CFA9B2|nr:MULTISPECIES: cation transporter [unclassified Fictibacillus]MBH0157199.1 heavy-metal-associated domain-containing protein [Fictibacillus sp. 5RED26]MBH0159520.1 heavy-metal-associated domain-containing protein [Fictibacillus sp. 26RED30]MBH0163680.1 heavy-metal-associated domain-containing protein [Fictibacillus sp. 7GRE50]MBH0169693.1 heavy-metal-associated domain-containing protein [Fictibacillus sp. 18YEL24]MBH0174193.1 heavy-metal-associated domain-containing protein [Fictibacillus sp.
MEKFEFKVNGMSCGHCEKAIQDALMESPGVESVKASASNNSVQVTYLSNKTNTALIKEIIEEEGYNVID